MKNFFTLTLCFLTLSLTAQIDNFPFNPDSNSDGFISVDDLMAMLSNFGEPFELPDYTEWSIGTMNNLLEYNESLNLLSDSLSALQSQLSYVQNNMESYLDSAINVALTSNTDICLIGGGSNSYSEWHYYLGGHDCRTVLYNRDSQSSRDLVMHLPINDNFNGKEIHIVGTGSSNQQGQEIRIEHFIDGAWIVLVQQSYGGDGWAAGEGWGRLGYIKARYSDNQWTWIQNQAFEMPFNQQNE